MENTELLVGPQIMSESRRKNIKFFLSTGRPYAHIVYAKKLLEYCLYDVESVRSDSFLSNGETVFTFTKDIPLTENGYHGVGSCQVKCTQDSYDVSIVVKIPIIENNNQVGETQKYHSKSFPIVRLYEVLNLIKLFYMGEPGNSVLFTGAFCPPHKGHEHLVKEAAERFDCVFMAISNQKFLVNKFKKSKQEMTWCFPENYRLDFLVGMTWNMPKVILHGVEEGYTYNVLCDVNNKYKPKSLWFTCGSDKLEEIPRWGFHDKLLVDFGFYVLQRDSDNIEAIRKRCDDIFKNYSIAKQSEYSDASSTKIREALSRDDFDYIKENIPKGVYERFQQMGYVK